MSQASLASRLGVTSAAVAQTERAEVAGGVTIAKLAGVAAALDCSLVYAFVPNSTLEDTVQRQARLLAKEQLGYVDTTMALEDQRTDEESKDSYLNEHVRTLVEHNTLWRVR
jgi:predicted DNA-binding mobile mystery protein A